MKLTSGNVLTTINPETGLLMASGARSRYTAAASALNVLWAAAESPGDGNHVSSILAYFEGRWHPITTVDRAGDMIRSLCIEPGLYGTLPRIWFGAGLQPAYITMPTTTQRRWLWDGVDYAPFGHLLTSWIDGNLLTIPKDWLQVEVFQTNPGALENDPPYTSLAWRPDEFSDWVAVGGKITTNGVSRVTFPMGSCTPKSQLRIELHRGTHYGAQATPIVEAVVVKYLERPQDLRAFTRTYELSSNAHWTSGLPVGLSLAEQLKQLETLREQQEPLTWYPWFGGSYQVHISNYSFSEVRERVIPEGGQQVGTINVSVSLTVLQ